MAPTGPATTVNVTISGRFLSRSFINPQSWRGCVTVQTRSHNAKPRHSSSSRPSNQRASADGVDSPTALEMLEELVGPGRRLPAGETSTRGSETGPSELGSSLRAIELLQDGGRRPHASDRWLVSGR